MLKLNNSLNSGKRIKLPKEWHDKILSFSKLETFPYEFVINKVVNDKEKYCICEAEEKLTENNKMVLTEHAAKYLLAEEVEDSNIGLSFMEYLPTINSKILITNNRNPSEVVPGIFDIKASLKYVDEETYIKLDFNINFMNGNGFTSINHYCMENKKYTWKFLLNQDTSYMTDYEKMFCDTLIHKEYVLKSCDKLATYLEKQGAEQHAMLLRQRAKIHDDSKISCEDELHALSSIINDKESLRDSSKQLSQIEQNALKLHWQHNTHHPEHFKTPIDMSKLDIMEMCCDWHARSVQYETNFLKFVEDRQEDRFHFPDWMFAEIWHYCEVLASEN